MALSFLKDRDENAVLGNLGNFACTLGGNSVQVRPGENLNAVWLAFVRSFG